MVVCIDTVLVFKNEKCSRMEIQALAGDTVKETVQVSSYSSSKSKRIYRSVLFAEMFPFLDVYDVR